MIKKDFSPTVYKYKDSVMENVENSTLFESYLKTKKFGSMIIWIDMKFPILHQMLPLLKMKVIKIELKKLCK